MSKRPEGLSVWTQCPERGSSCTAWPSAQMRSSSPPPHRKVLRSALTKLSWMPSAGAARKSQRLVLSYDLPRGRGREVGSLGLAR